MAFPLFDCGVRFPVLISAVQSAAWGPVGHASPLATLSSGSWNYPLWLPHSYHRLLSPSSRASSFLPDLQSISLSQALSSLS